MRRQRTHYEECLDTQHTVTVTVSELQDVSWGLYLARLNAAARVADCKRSGVKWAIDNAIEDLNNIKCAESILNSIVERAYNSAARDIAESRMADLD